MGVTPPTMQLPQITARMAAVLSAAVRASYSTITRARWLSTSSVLWQQSGAQVAVSEDRRKLTLQCEGEQERRFHGIWLRHNCRCPVCYSHNDNMSRVSYKQLVGVELTSAHVKGAKDHASRGLAISPVLQETRLSWSGYCKMALLTLVAFL